MDMSELYGWAPKKTIQPIPPVQPANPYKFLQPGANGQYSTPSSGVWTKQGQELYGQQAGGDYGTSNYSLTGQLTPEFLASLGYTGGAPSIETSTGASLDSGGAMTTSSVNPEWEKFLKDKGLTLAGMQESKNATNGLGADDTLWHIRAFDQGGNAVGSDSQTKVNENDNAFGVAMLLASMGAGSAVAGAGAGVAGAGGAAGMEGVTPVLAGEFGELGYGGLQAAAGGAGGLAGTGLPEYAAYQGPGSLGYQVAGDVAVSPGAGTLGAANGLDSAASAALAGQSAPGAALNAAGAVGAGGGVNSMFGLTIPEMLGGTGAAGSAASQAAGSYKDPYANMPGSSPSWADKLKDFAGNNPADLAKLLLSGGALAGGALGGSLGGGGTIGMPNYTGAANSSALSARTDQTNPYGSLKYTQTGVDAQGNPVYKQDVSLNPQGSANLSSAQTAQGTALGSWNDVLKNAGADWSSIPGVYGNAGSQADLVKQAQDAMYSQQTRYLDPQYKQQQDSLSSSLANQGVTMGSQAYTTAMDNFARQRDSAYGNARDSSINQGNTFAGQLFNQGLAAHNTGVSDWSTHLTGSGNAATTAGANANSFNPSFAATPAPTNFLGAAALQGQGQLNQYNATTGAQNSFQNGLFNLGGSVLSNPSWTDLLGSFFKPGP